MDDTSLVDFEDYEHFLREIKQRIQKAQIRAALAVNHELVLLYWHIGRDILAKQQQQGWGAKVIDRLAADLKSAFPELKGLSRTNLLYMRAFADAYPKEEFVQQVVGQIPWGHNARILDLVKDATEREWYIRSAIEHGWSRNVLVLQIESRLYHRQGKAITNYERSLPAPQSDLAQQVMKDPYIFDFLTVRQDAHERDIERGLLYHIRSFLLELGVGFAFVGSQYHLEVGDDDFYIDLLFYHLKLRCFVVIDLKAGKFQPAYAGQMNFYLSVVDDLLRQPDDKPSIGIILCKNRNKVVAEYALRDMSKPIGVSSFKITAELPEQLRGILPSIKDIEAGFETQSDNTGAE